MKGSRVALLLVLLLLAAACGDSASPDSSANTAVATSARGAEARDPDPLLLGLSIHVEGWQQEAVNEDMFRIHSEGLLMMARIAADHGAVLTFELSEVFMDAVTQWDSDIVDVFHSLGHGTGIHADIGGRGDPSFQQLVAPLARMRNKARSIGVDVRHVSGICSRGPWVEAAIEAEFISTNGAVEYCATSLSPDAIPSGSEHLLDCVSPAECHGPLPVDLVSQIHPYLIDSSSDFLTPADEGLVLMLGSSGGAVDCADEGATGTGCEGTAADLPHAEEVLQRFLDGRDPGRIAALTMSWSVGSIPSETFVDEFLAVFDAAVASGEARWMSNGDIGELALQALTGDSSG